MNDLEALLAVRNILGEPRAWDATDFAIDHQFRIVHECSATAVAWSFAGAWSRMNSTVDADCHQLERLRLAVRPQGDFAEWESEPLRVQRSVLDAIDKAIKEMTDG